MLVDLPLLGHLSYFDGAGEANLLRVGVRGERSVSHGANRMRVLDLGRVEVLEFSAGCADVEVDLLTLINSIKVLLLPL